MKLVTSLECLLFYTTFSGRQPWAYCSKHLRIISRSDHSSKATQDIKANGREAREVVRPGQGDRSPRGDRSESSGDRADHDEGAQAAGPGRATGRAATG